MSLMEQADISESALSVGQKKHLATHLEIHRPKKLLVQHLVLRKKYAQLVLTKIPKQFQRRATHLEHGNSLSNQLHVMSKGNA